MGKLIGKLQRNITQADFESVRLQSAELIDEILDDWGVTKVGLAEQLGWKDASNLSHILAQRPTTNAGKVRLLPRDKLRTLIEIVESDRAKNRRG